MIKKTQKGHTERVAGSVYTARPGLGKGRDVRAAQLAGSYYGNKPRPMPLTPTSGQLPGFAGRTQIRTR